MLNQNDVEILSEYRDDISLVIQAIREYREDIEKLQSRMVDLEREIG